VEQYEFHTRSTPSPGTKLTPSMTGLATTGSCEGVRYEDEYRHCMLHDAEILLQGPANAGPEIFVNVPNPDYVKGASQ
jgi:hypothetical protein